MKPLPFGVLGGTTSTERHALKRSGLSTSEKVASKAAGRKNRLKMKYKRKL